jgi:tetratricopeptide (TPR) repeat protein
LNALLVKYYAMLCRENAQEHEDTSNHKPGAANTLNAKQTQKTEAAATPSFAIKANAADSCEALLDDSRRPKWYHTSQAATISGKGLEDTTKPTDVISSDLEIRPFIDKSAPNILALKTANGLDKLFVDSCWNSIKGYSTSNNNSSNFINVGTLGNTNKSATHMKAAQATKLQLPNQSTLASGSDRSSARGGAGSSSRKSSSRSARPNTSRDSARGTGGGGGNTSGRLVPVAGIPVGSARPSTTSGDHAGRGKNGNGDALTNDTRRQSNLAAVLSTAQVQQQQQAQQRLTTMMAVAAATDNAQKEIKAEKDASRQIAKLAKTTAHDIHFALLGNMDSLLHRQLNQGERDLLVEGLRIEGEEDFDRAHIFYSRAGMHSHEKHLSKIFLGCLSYKRKSFLSAIRYFSTAILMLEELRGHSENYEADSFRAHYNRAVTLINCGDDEEGVKDLEFAVNLKGDNILARQTYAVALRRIGKFESAISNTLKCKEVQLTAANEARNLAFLDDAAAAAQGAGGTAAAGAATGPPADEAAAGSLSHQRSSMLPVPLGSMTSINENDEDASVGAAGAGAGGNAAGAPPPSLIHHPSGLKRDMSTAKFTQLLTRE